METPGGAAEHGAGAMPIDSWSGSSAGSASAIFRARSQLDRTAAGKFRRRFEGVESMVAGRGIDVRAADLATLDALWDEVKSLE